MWGEAILYYLIISSFILGSVDNGNCYIGGKTIQYWKYGGSGESKL